MEIDDARKRFLKTVEGHQMTSLQECGLHRHFRFRNPQKSAYWFDLITWPGFLCVTGDCGSYVFSRVEDMFAFFREEQNPEGELQINPDYWSEKLEAQNCNGVHAHGIRRWSPERFEAPGFTESCHGRTTIRTSRRPDRCQMNSLLLSYRRIAF